ncbi:MAG: hypothetical protein Q8Q59_08270 [Luteolibacter sp.]|jgi:hypothetical protein|nr:hypothetical protein [Luteolibacter sp.]
MNYSVFKFFEISTPLSITVPSPRLDLMLLTWEHIAARYLSLIQSNPELSGRVRAIRLLAVHDAIQSVIDPGNGRVYKEPSAGRTTEAAFAAAVQASHDILATVFTATRERRDLADLLAESLSLISGEKEKAAGILSGQQSAKSYLNTFISLLLSNSPPPKAAPAHRPRELALAGSGGF